MSGRLTSRAPTPEWTPNKDDWKASLKIVSKKCYGYGFGWSIDAASVDASSDPPA
jgi:hypothetical protein